MNGAANAPASSLPSRAWGAAREGPREGPREGNTSLLSPFLESAFLSSFPTSSAFPPGPGGKGDQPGFPSILSAYTSQVQFKEIRLSWEGMA